MDHSFVIPVYGESPYLAQCIESLKAQTVKSPIILCAPKDSDFLKETAKKYHLPTHINPNGGGIGKDWNYALDQAETDLVTIAHQDDIYNEDYTEKILESYEKNPDSVITFTDYGELRGDNIVKSNLNLRIKRILLMPFRIRPGKWSQKFSIMFGSSICCPSVTYNKEELNNYKFDEELKSNLDWKAWVDFYKAGKKFNYVPKQLMYHRIHDDSETSKVLGENNRKTEDIEILKEIWPDWAAKIIGTVYQLSEKSNNG